MHLLTTISLITLGSLSAALAGETNTKTTTTTTLKITPSIKYQPISGFGFSEAFQRAHALTSLPPSFQSSILDLLFHPQKGAGFTILRLGLGSSPDSRGDHMNSPQPAPDKPFAWDGDDSGQVWVAREAMRRYGVDTFIADAWSAPGYMKTNGRDDLGGWLCGVRGTTETKCNGTSFVEEYAEYLARYVRAWVVEGGIPVRYVGFLNEPNLNKTYATMQSDGYQAADIAFALAPKLKEAGLADKVGISCCEGQGWSYSRDLLAEMQDAGAEGLLELVTTHTYKGTPAKPDRPLNTTLPVWVTEISPIMDRLGMTQTWYRNHSENEGLLHAINIHEALTTGNVSAYVYWIGVGQSKGEAPYIWAPPANGTAAADMWHSSNNGGNGTATGAPPYTIGSTYWGSAHFSRFVRPGATRVDVAQTGTDNVTGVLASAYRNLRAGIVAQVINNGDEKVSATLVLSDDYISPGNDCRLEVWVSDNERKLMLVQDGRVHLGESAVVREQELSPRSLTTFNLTCL
ncbi:glycoside hydrolase family 30 protein [Echria macrotheca]|uniref:Glycoside hydrolase family 30 protein n=1 Tax=Echria macrotheca TaxID=438768 RepID=A0AAJ0B8J8_9PEZI|nr:glycoside hydrolase family 30 protein [Echria macrotheca]